MPKIISIANRKGGIGKTTCSINISNELVQMGYLVLMIDLDAQCDLSKIFLKRKNTDQGDIFKLFKGECSIQDAIYNIKDNLYISPGNNNLIHLQEKDIINPLVKVLNEDFFNEVDYIIIDHPPNINEGALQGFNASDEVLIVIEPEAFCIENINQLLDDLYHIQFTDNPNLHILGIVLNRIDMRRNLTKHMIDKIESSFNSHILKSRISNNTSIPLSLNDKVAVRDLKWWSKPVGEFKDLVNEIIERMKDNEHE
ncbi:MAG: ParA family protein [Halanaerobiales bacterium]